MIKSLFLFGRSLSSLLLFLLGLTVDEVLVDFELPAQQFLKLHGLPLFHSTNDVSQIPTDDQLVHTG